MKSPSALLPPLVVAAGFVVKEEGRANRGELPYYFGTVRMARTSAVQHRTTDAMSAE